MTDTNQSYGKKHPKIYRIDVAGVLDSKWSDRLGGLSIKNGTGDDPNKTITVLEGPIRDQAELSGILTTLNDLRYSLLSVKIVQE
jgi:hypothetical protein